MPEKVFLLLNGEAPKRLPDVSRYALICATDGAYSTLEQHGITPDLVAGDFDSCPDLPKKPQTQVVHTPDQNYTDFEKMLKVLYQRGYQAIDIFGASAQAQDHFLGNLHTAVRWKERLRLTFFDDFGAYFLADPHTILTDVKHKIISLIPLPTAEDVFTEGLKYPLKNETLAFGTRIGTRNEATAHTATIRFEKGHLLIFVSQRRNISD